jgi:hypothetical protein
MIVAWIGMMVFALHASTHMVGAGDTWVAMACGRHFLNHGVDTVEPFSANSHKAGPTEEEIETWPGPAKWIAKKVGIDTVRYWHPTGWVNQNWLTHVLFYWLTHESPFADAEERSFNSLVCLLHRAHTRCQSPSGGDVCMLCVVCGQVIFRCSSGGFFESNGGNLLSDTGAGDISKHIISLVSSTDCGFLV